MPFFPTRCSSVCASCASSSSSRRRASRIRLELNAPHSPRFDVISSTADRRTPAPRRLCPGCRNRGNRSARSGEYSSPITSASACAYGRAPTTRSCARLSFDVETSSIVFVILRVFWTERRRGGGIELEPERGKRFQLAILPKVEPQPPGDLLHRLDLRVAAHSTDGNAGVHGGPDVRVKEIGFEEDLSVGDRNDVGRNVGRDVARLRLDDRQPRQRSTTHFI